MPRKAQKYDIYHDSFTDAMKHAYEYAKTKFGITIDDDEIWHKVSSGPRKPTTGKTNRYRLEGDKGNLQIQVYNTGNKYELNMYKEEVELGEALGTNRPRAGGGRQGKKITDNLRKHSELTKKYIDQGMDKDAASKKAYNDIVHKEEVDEKKKEDIVKGMKKNKEDLKARYGDRWKSVMHATATKNARNKSVELDEDFELPDYFLLDEAIDPKVKAKAAQYLRKLKSKSSEYSKKYGPRAKEVMQQTAISMARKGWGATKQTGRFVKDITDGRKSVDSTVKRHAGLVGKSLYRNAKAAGKLAIKGADKAIDRINKEEVELDEKVDGRKVHSMYNKDGKMKHDMRFKMYRNNNNQSPITSDVTISNDADTSNSVEGGMEESKKPAFSYERGGKKHTFDFPSLKDFGGPVKKKTCPSCKGKGCKECDGTGKIYEETLHESNLDTLRNIVKKHQAQDIKLGSDELTVDAQSANAIVKLFDTVNDANKKKLERMINSNETNFMKVVDFAFSKLK